MGALGRVGARCDQRGYGGLAQGGEGVAGIAANGRVFGGEEVDQRGDGFGVEAVGGLQGEAFAFAVQVVDGAAVEGRTAFAAVPVPHALPHCLPRIVFCWPVGAGGVPTGTVGLLEAGEEEFDHIARPLGRVGHGAMPEVVVDQDHGAGLAGKRDFAGQIFSGITIVIVAAGDDAGRTKLDGCVLGVVEGHAPAGAVVALGPGVLVHVLPLAARRVEVAVAVGVEVVVGAEDALQGAVYLRVVEDALDGRYARQQVIAGVALLCKDFIEPLADLGVEVWGQVGFKADIAVTDVFLHARVVEPAGGVCHGVSPLVGAEDAFFVYAVVDFGEFSRAVVLPDLRAEAAVNALLVAGDAGG